MKQIRGNTFPVKDKLKALGGRWNAAEKCWEVPDDKEQEANQIVASAPQAETRRCWECGCEFTYAECKRNGGDWNENGGYCGC